MDGITHSNDVGTELVSLHGSFYGSNDGKFEGLLIGDSLGYCDFSNSEKLECLLIGDK